MKTFAEVHKVLRGFWPDELSPKVAVPRESIFHILDYLDNPQEKVKVVHIAGTSGKSSTAYYAAALLKAAGKKAGMIVSPHVDEVNERVQINLQPLSEAEFCSELTVFLDLVAKSGIQLNYFEVMVAFAFWEFARKGMEYAVVEVGLGGLSDTTNVVQRLDKVCVITDIGLDHMHVLGNTLAEIASQKAGIIQLRNAVFCYRQVAKIMAPITARAQQKQADLHLLYPSAVQTQFVDLPLFQQRNLGLSRAAIGFVLERDGEKLTEEMVKVAAQTFIPARMEVMTYQNRPVIVDAAHNSQKLAALFRSIRHKYPGQPVAVVVGFLGIRHRSVKVLAEAADHIIVTAFHNAQDDRHNSGNPERIATLFAEAGAQSVEVITDARQALEALLKRPEPMLLVTGSFYLLNDIRPLLREQH